jgi:undecaprenyl-diphosphatase
MNGLIVALGRADRRLLHALVVRRRPLVDAAMRLVTRLGDVRVVAPTALALALGVVPPLQQAGDVALWSLIGSHLCVQLLKRAVSRARPLRLSFLTEPEDRFSFPSGHAAAGLSVALPLAVALGGPGAVLVLTAGLAVGASRCYLGVHYPGDVLAGWALGACGVLVASVLTGWIG